MDLDPPPSPLGETTLDSKFTTPVRPTHQDRQPHDNNEEPNQHIDTSINTNSNIHMAGTHVLFSTTTTPFKFIPPTSLSAMDTPGPSPTLGTMRGNASPEDYLSYVGFLSPLAASNNPNHLNMGLMMMPSVSPLRNPSSLMPPSASPLGLGMGYSPLPAWLNTPGHMQEGGEGGTQILVTPQSIWKTHPGGTGNSFGTGNGNGIRMGTGVQAASSPDASNFHSNSAIHAMHAQGLHHGHGQDFHVASFFESPRNVFQQYRAGDMDYSHDIAGNASGNAQRPPLNLTGPSHYRSMGHDGSDEVDNDGVAGADADRESEVQIRAAARPARKKSYKRKLDFTASISGSASIQATGSVGTRPILMGTDSITSHLLQMVEAKKANGINLHMHKHVEAVVKDDSDDDDNDDDSEEEEEPCTPPPHVPIPISKKIRGGDAANVAAAALALCSASKNPASTKYEAKKVKSSSRNVKRTAIPPEVSETPKAKRNSKRRNNINRSSTKRDTSLSKKHIMVVSSQETQTPSQTFPMNQDQSNTVQSTFRTPSPFTKTTKSKSKGNAPASKKTHNAMVMQMTTPVTELKADFPKEKSEDLKCKCKNTECLKLYCVCFAASGVCGKSCKCVGCSNRLESKDKVMEARTMAEERIPGCFKSKVISNGPVFKDGVLIPSESHFRGCKCKRSGCRKKYCECYQANVPCGPKCVCSGCQNDAKGQLGILMNSTPIATLGEDIDHQESRTARRISFGPAADLLPNKLIGSDSPL